MKKRKSYKVASRTKSGALAKVPTKLVSSFNVRLSAAIKTANRDFQKKQKVSAEKASKIVLNA